MSIAALKFEAVIQRWWNGLGPEQRVQIFSSIPLANAALL